ncbi:MAG: lipid II flippase MurJ, partial [Anaerolineaceae bacterium]|nr:lipid II flippase MurJ [Anaerolineaceae bacterium]
TIGTAILPTISAHFSRKDWQAFSQTVERAVRVFIALSLTMAAVLAMGLRPLLVFAFGFSDQGTDLVFWVTRGFLLGLLGHCLLEVAARSFYAQQDARKPLLAAMLNVGVYILLGSQLFRSLGAPGISLTESIAITNQALLLVLLLIRQTVDTITFGSTLLRGLLAAAAGWGVTYAVQLVLVGTPPVVSGLLGIMAGGLVVIPLVWTELRILARL